MLSKSGKTKMQWFYPFKKRIHLSRSRVVINLSGGLGNQLFQVAAGSHLKLQNIEVVLDPIENDLNGYRKTRIMELSKGMGLNLIQRSQISKAFIRLIGIRKIIHFLILRDAYKELEPFEILEVNQSNPPKRVVGYWQNKQMALHVKNYLDEKNDSEIKTNQLAIHVRRGDYLNLAHQLHGALHGDYFLAATKSIIEHKKIDKIAIFSDSINQVMEESWVGLLPDIEIEFSQNSDPWESLLEMSSFETIICSNSTFSWWAAFLNKNKTIVLPDHWFRNFRIPAGLQIKNAKYVESKFI